jgi:hypothetical protein
MIQVGRCICGPEGMGYREYPTLRVLIKVPWTDIGSV